MVQPSIIFILYILLLKQFIIHSHEIFIPLGMNKDLVTRKCSNGNKNNYFSVVIKNSSLKFYWNLNAKYWFSLSIYKTNFTTTPNNRNMY